MSASKDDIAIKLLQITYAAILAGLCIAIDVLFFGDSMHEAAKVAAYVFAGWMFLCWLHEIGEGIDRRHRELLEAIGRIGGRSGTGTGTV